MSHAPANTVQHDPLDEALRVFQPRTSRVLTREDARQINENLTGFFRVLQDWDRKARASSIADEDGLAAGVAPSPQPGARP